MERTAQATTNGVIRTDLGSRVLSCKKKPKEMPTWLVLGIFLGSKTNAGGQNLAFVALSVCLCGEY